MTLPDLKQDPQVEANFYLKNIYQILGDTNGSRPYIPFTPAETPKHVIWVNSLWSLSLVISLTCAMLATFIQQWARRYIKATQLPRYHDPHDQARIREYLFQGINKSYLPGVVEVLPPLIHISLFLFFTGLLIYLSNLNHIAFCAVVWWVAVAVVTYLFITVMPTLRIDSPYYSALSPLVYSLSAVILYVVLLLFCYISCCCSWVGTFKHHCDHLHDRFSKGREQMIKAAAQDKLLSPKIDGCILKSTIDAAIKDRKQDQLFQCILGFCSSKLVKESKTILRSLDGKRLSSILITFLERTWSSNVVLEPDKIQRFVKCVKMADVARLSDVVPRILHNIFDSDNHMVLRSVEIGHSLITGGHENSRESSQEIGLCARLVVAGIIANGDQNNEEWIALATAQLGEDLPRYREHGRDSVLFANLIHATRLIFKDGLDIGHRIPYIVLSRLTKFDIHKTHPDLQLQFKSLWSDIELGVGTDKHLSHIITCLGYIYSALTPSNDAAPAALTPAPPVVAPTSTSPTPAPGSTSLPVSTSPLPHLNNSPSLPSLAAGHPRPSTSRSSPPTSSIGGFSIPASPPSARVQSVPRAKLLALLSGTSVPRPTGHQALPPLHARGLVNKGNMCFSNAVLQLLVHTPPFWELFRELGPLVGQRGREDDQESGGVQTPLVDATVRFSEEFVYEERENWFDPTFMHDAMKDGKLSRIMRVRCFVLCRPSVSDPCWRTCIGWPRGCSRVLGPLSRRTP